MIKKLYSNKQLSYFFQIAIIFNIIELLSDILVYRYFSNYTWLKKINENISNLSIFIVCLIMISQALRFFIQKHKHFVSHYKLLAVSIEIAICFFLTWLLMIDNTTQENFIIFCSNTSRTDHSLKIILILILICSSLIYQLYKTITAPDFIDKITVSEMIRAVFRLLIIRYAVIAIAYFQFIHLNTFHDYFTEIIGQARSSLFFDANLLGITLPIAWIVTITYYLYTKYFQKHGL